jgi:hypothetical protein
LEPLGSKKKVLKKLEAIPGKHSTDSLQKTAILGTSRTIRKVLQSETESLSGEDHSWLKKRNTGKESPVTKDMMMMTIMMMMLMNLLTTSYYKMQFSSSFLRFVTLTADYTTNVSLCIHQILQKLSQMLEILIS